MLIVPKRDNSGRDLGPLTRDIAAELVAAFGGCTARDAKGMWNNGAQTISEPVTELVAATPTSPQTDSTLRRLAERIDHDGRQVRAYCRFPDGHVELIPANDNRPRLAA